MRIARTLLLACAAALAALALGATNASAAEAIEVDKEDGTNCNPCVVHATGESEIHHPLFGEVSDCADEFEGEIYHNGTGHISHWNGQNHPVDGPCTRENCDGAGGEGLGEGEWPITNAEENAANQGEMNVRFCLDAISDEPEAAGLHCDADVIVTDDNAHNLTFATTATCPTSFGNVTVTGSWSSESTTHDAIDVVHLGA